MVKYCRSFFTYIALAVIAFASVAAELSMRIVSLAAEQLTPQKLEAELAQNVAHKFADNRKPVSIGSGSGDSPLSFVSMLKAINSRSFSAAA